VVRKERCKPELLITRWTHPEQQAAEADMRGSHTWCGGCWAAGSWAGAVAQRRMWEMTLPAATLMALISLILLLSNRRSELDP